MPLYQYQGIDTQQKKISGIFSANTLKDARYRLRDKNIIITKIKEKKGDKQTIKSQKICEFTEQLSYLLSGGLPLHDSLMALEEQYHGDPLHRIVLHLSEHVQQGATFSEGLKHFPEIFDLQFLALVEAGELSGQLSQSLNEIHKLLTKKIKLKSDLISALLYPAILASFSLLVIGLLLGYVVPSIEALFEDRTLNGFTQFVLTLSHNVKSYGWIYLIGLLGSIATIRLSLKKPYWKETWERFLLKIPFVKNVIIQSSLTRFFTTLSSLQESGVTTIEALNLSQKAITYSTIRESVTQATEKMLEGQTLSSCLKKTQIVPSLAIRMLKVGEESGQQTASLSKMAIHYENELDTILKRVMTLAQPLILIIMGALIFVILLAILLPLTDVDALGL